MAAKSTRQELIEQLEDAQTKLREAHEILADVARETDDGHAKAYLVDHLAIFIDSEHGFLSQDFNVQKWIEQIQENESLEDEEE